MNENCKKRQLHYSTFFIFLSPHTIQNLGLKQLRTARAGNLKAFLPYQSSICILKHNEHTYNIHS